MDSTPLLQGEEVVPLNAPGAIASPSTNVDLPIPNTETNTDTDSDSDDYFPPPRKVLPASDLQLSTDPPLQCIVKAPTQGRERLIGTWEFLQGDQEFQGQELPDHLKSQLEGIDMSTVAASGRVVVNYSKGANNDPNLTTAGRVAPFVACGTLDRLAVAFYRRGSKRVLVAKGRAGIRWNNDQAAILRYKGGGTPKRSVWYEVWKPHDSNKPLIVEKVHNGTFMRLSDGNIVVNEAKDSNGSQNQPEKQRLEHGSITSVSEGRKRSSESDGGEQHSPSTSKRHKSSSQPQHSPEPGTVIFSSQDTNKMDNAAHTMASKQCLISAQKQPTGQPSVSVPLRSDPESKHGHGSMINQNDVQTPELKSSLRNEKGLKIEDEEVSLLDCLIPKEEIKTHNLQSKQHAGICDDGKIIFVFPSGDDISSAREKPFEKCNTVKKLFMQALVSGIVNQDNKAVQVRVAGVEQQRFNIMIGDEDDFNRLVRCLRRQSKAHNDAVRAIVAPLDFSDE